MSLIFSLRGNQPATHDMLQKEIINILQMIMSDLRDTWSNTALIEFV